MSRDYETQEQAGEIGDLGHKLVMARHALGQLVNGWQSDMTAAKDYDALVWDARAVLDSLAGVEAPAVTSLDTARDEGTVFCFDRYRFGKKLAQGARVRAHSREKALAKAKALFPEPDCGNDEFRSRERADDHAVSAHSVVTEDMVNRFLSWPLPASVCSDWCVTDRAYEHPRIGTNLLTADEARAMLEHVMGGPTPKCDCKSNECNVVANVGKICRGLNVPVVDRSARDRCEQDGCNARVAPGVPGELIVNLPGFGSGSFVANNNLAKEIVAFLRKDPKP